MSADARRRLPVLRAMSLPPTMREKRATHHATRSVRVQGKSLIRQTFLLVTRRYTRAPNLTFFGSTGSERIPTLTTMVSVNARAVCEHPPTWTMAREQRADNVPSSLLTMSLRSGSLAALVALVIASVCVCSDALAGGFAGEGFRPVSEEFHGNTRAPEDVPMRSNSIRTDVSRYNAERSTPRSPGNAGDPGRQIPPMHNGYRTN